MNLKPIAFPGALSVWSSLGFGPSSGAKPTPTRNLEQSCTSVWWMATQGLRKWILSRTMNRRAFGKLWPGTGNGMAATRNASWRINFTATGRRWLFVRSMGSVYPVQRWASRQKIRSCSTRRKNRSTRTSVTATLWREPLVRPKPLMVWPMLQRAFGRPLAVSSQSLSCS